MLFNKRLASLTALLLASLIMSGCATTSGTTKTEQQREILTMKDEVLTDLFKLKPDVRPQINAAPGYAVFTNVNLNVVVASFGGGYGVAKNMKTGKYTYMKMGEVGVGLGAGIKDFRAVFIFHSMEAFDRFIEYGWAFGGQADAAAKAGEKGAAVAGEVTADNVSIYQMTESGLSLQATLKGTKYWVDEELN